MLDRRMSRGGDDEEAERRLSVVVSISESVPEIESGVKEFCRSVLEATSEQLEEGGELLVKARLLPQFALFRRFRNAEDAARVIKAFHDGRLAACVRKLWELKKKKVRVVSGLGILQGGGAPCTVELVRLIAQGVIFEHYSTRMM